MLKNYLKIALRNLRRHPAYTGINVGGLAVGLACCLLIFLFVRDELSYDRFHANADSIYRVVLERRAEGSTSDRAVTPPALAPMLREDFPEMRAAVRFFDIGRTLIRRGDRQFYEPKVYYADSTVFDVFSLPFVHGDPATALRAPYSVVVSETVARKFFGEADPLGETLDVGLDNDLTVTGVFEDLPLRSHLNLSVLIAFDTLYDTTDEGRLESWIWQQFFTYVLLPEGYNPALLEAKFPDFVARHAEEETSSKGFSYGFHLQPLADIYLRSAHLEFDWGVRGNIDHVYAFSAVALFILLIACFNFMNLTTARSMQRAREVGLRKMAGARRGQLVRQFLGESLLLALLALVLALVLAEAVLPAFNTFTGKTLRLDFTDAGLVLGLLLIGGVVGLLAGSYPAFFLSSFRPTSVLKGTGGAGAVRMGALRKGLVVAQFAISIALLVGAAVIHRQLDFVQQKDLGFDRELLVKLPLRGDTDTRVEALKAELLRHPNVTAATASWGSPGSFAAGDDIRLPGSDATWPTNMFTVDHDFAVTYGLHLVAGRDFRRDFPSDEQEAFLLNETAARGLGWSPEEALGQEIWWDVWGGEGEVKQGTVIGVVQDFNYKSLRQAVEPLVMHLFPNYGQLSVRLRPQDVTASLAFLEAQWQQWAPAWPFEYDFLDAELAEAYLSEEKLGRLSSAFAGLAVLIACLGLFGLASFAAERRTKEIGVRKVLGASVGSIVGLLSKDFLKLVGVAFVLAVPVAYLLMQRWLEAFVYRIELSWGLFALAGAAALGIAFLTVSVQAIRAALTNPTETLRYE